MTCLDIKGFFRTLFSYMERHFALAAVSFHQVVSTNGRKRKNDKERSKKENDA